MLFDLTHHARHALEERKIALDWVERVLANPEQIEPHEFDPELEHRFGKIVEHGGRVLHIVVATGHPERVITAYFDRTRKGMP